MPLAIPQAIEAVYAAFADAPKPAEIAGCPCCLAEKRTDVLLSRPLRQLTPDELGPYAASVFLTVGEADDFFYFLPRILEIRALQESWWPDPEVVADKFPQANFAGWPNHRQRAIRDYFDAVFHRHVNAPQAARELDAWLCAVARAGWALPPFLDRIAAAPTALLAYYEYNSASLLKHRLANSFWRDVPECEAVVVAWFQTSEMQARTARLYGL